MLYRRNPVLLTLLLAAICVSARGEELSTEQVKRFLDDTEAARTANEERLITADGTGTLTVVLYDNEQEEPIQLTDAILNVVYDSPKFLIKIDNRTRLRERRGDEAQWAMPWIDAGIVQELIIFDGESLYHIQWKRDDTCTGEIYFPFSRQAVLRSAGFPFEHPIHIWREALNLSRVKPERTQITPLVGGGYKAVETMNSYDTKFFVFNQFGYDLRRVSTQRTDNGIPIREYSLKWEKSAQAHYLSQFSNTVTKTRVNPRSDEPEVLSKLTTKVTYERFLANVTIAAERFTLGFHNIPDGTQFVDKRRRTQRNPAILYFEDGQLVSPEQPN